MDAMRPGFAACSRWRASNDFPLKLSEPQNRTCSGSDGGFACDTHRFCARHAPCLVHAVRANSDMPGLIISQGCGPDELRKEGCSRMCASCFTALCENSPVSTPRVVSLQWENKRKGIMKYQDSWLEIEHLRVARRASPAKFGRVKRVAQAPNSLRCVDPSPSV